MLALGKPAPRARLEPVRPVMLAMEPSFLTDHPRPAPADAATVRDEAEITAQPCPGCGRVHRDRLVRFFQVRWAGNPHPADDADPVGHGPGHVATLANTPHLAMIPRVIRAGRIAHAGPEHE